MLSVLIIDDSSTIRKMLGNMLENMSCNIIATASSGEEGIKLYEQHKPDIVTMDVNMPGMSGMEALKNIRDKNQDANVLMLTSRGDNKLVVDSIKYGAKGYILKPLNQDKIKEAIVNIYPNAFKIEEEIVDEDSGIQNYESSIKDSLTDLYTVQYMHSTMQHLIEMHNQNNDFSIGLIIVSVNNLEDISTNYGVMQKDIILTQIADEIQTTIRSTDFPIKLTNNEFAVFILGNVVNDINIIAEKLKQSIEAIQNEAAMQDTTLNINIGMAIHKQQEKLIPFIERADEAVAQASKDDNITMAQ